MDYGLLYFYTEKMGFNYLYAAAISFTSAVVINYWLCLAYVFTAASRQNSRQAIIFIGSSIIGLGLNQVCMWFFVEMAGLYYMLAKIFSAGIVAVWNYVMKRKAMSGN
jgi:putative flippase GtrA